MRHCFNGNVSVAERERESQPLISNIVCPSLSSLKGVDQLKIKITFMVLIFYFFLHIYVLNSLGFYVKLYN